VALSAFLAVAGVSRAGEPAQDLTVTRATLANGLKVVVVRDPLAPVVTTLLNYEAGSNDQRIKGQAHALEHMMFRGSATLTESQLADIAELAGGDWDADTQAEVTQYFFTAPAKYLDLLLRMEASRAQHLTLAQKDWAIERGAIKNEVTQDDSQPTQKLFRQIDENVFAGSPYSNDGLGTLDSFDNQINAPQLRAFYNAYYHPNNAIYVIVGDIDPKTTVAEVKKYFGAIPAAKLPKRVPVNVTPLKSKTFTVDSDQPYTIASLTYRFPGYDDKDYAAGQILENVLSSQRSKLYDLVAQGKALQAAFGDFDTHPKAGSAFGYLVVPVTTKPSDAIAALRSVLDDYRANGVPPELVEAEKRRALAAAEYKANSVEDLAFQWSQAVAVEGYASPDSILSSISNVTVDDVNRVLREYVDPKHEIIGIAAPKNGAAATGGSASGPASEASQNNPTLLHHDPLPAWATLAFAHVPVPSPAYVPVDTTLSNGIRLIVVPQKVSQTVVVHGSIETNEGIQAPAGLDGVADITANLLPYGTTTYDRLGLRAELDKIAAEVQAGTTFSLTARSQDFDRGVELLADEELHPAFPATAFDAVKQQEVGSVQGVVNSPDHATEVALNTALYPPTDPLQRFATPTTAGNVMLADVKAYYASVYRPDLTTIVVVGNVDPDHAKAVFEKEFGGWTAAGPKPDVDLPAVPNNTTKSVIVPDPQKVQSSVKLVEVSSLTRSDPDYAALAVANDAFGGSASGILFHDVRDVHGLVYGVYSAARIGKNRSTFSIEYACDPDKILPAQALILSDLRNLATNGLVPNDLVRGRAELVSRIPMRAASFDGIATQLIDYAQLGLPLDQATIDARSEIGVTNDQVKAAVAKWIRQGDFVRVIEGPGPKT
jgi:zinc protease